MIDINYNQVYTKFYQRDHMFKKFDGIDEDKFMEIKSLVERKEMYYRSGRPFGSMCEPSKYLRTLNYLTNPLIHTELYSFDERVLYFILACDPDLVIYKNYMASELVDMIRTRKMMKANGIEISGADEQLYKASFSNLEGKCRSEIGMFDSQFIKYERAYFNKFLSNTLIPKFGGEIELFNILIKKSKNFSKISPERFEELNKLVQDYISNVGNVDNKTLIYHLVYQSNILGIHEGEEQILFYVLVRDPNLDIYQIFVDESKWQNILEQSYEQFKIANKDLVLSEAEIAKTFFPDKKFEFGSK